MLHLIFRSLSLGDMTRKHLYQSVSWMALVVRVSGPACSLHFWGEGLCCITHFVKGAGRVLLCELCV